MGFDFCHDLIHGLGFHKPDVAFGDRNVRQYGLRTRTTVAAVQPVDGQGGPERQPFIIGTFERCVEALQPETPLDLGFVERQVLRAALSSSVGGRTLS